MSAASMALAMLIADPVTLGATPPPISQEKPADDVVQAEADTYDRMTIEAVVHGIGPFRFIIDTGSQRTVLSTALAATLGLAEGPQLRVVGIAGSRHVTTAQVHSIAVGALSFRDLTVPLLERINIGADGILGTDSLQHQRVLLDFTRNRISIADRAAKATRAEFEIVVRAKRRSGRLILTNALIDGTRTDVVIDTGASGTIGNRALQRSLARKRQKALGTSEVSSVTGHLLPVELAVAGKLELGRMTLFNVPVAYADAPAFAELRLDRKPAIFLGMRELRAFKRVAIDFSSRKVLFDLVDAK